MSVRDRYPQPKLPTSHYFFSVSRGDSIRTVVLRPVTLWALLSLAPLTLLTSAGAAAYVAFHDDMLRALTVRQAEMQAAYEDRIADARAQLDQVAGRQLLDQNSFEGKLHDLLSRQARLEQRSSVVAALATQAVGRGPVTALAKTLAKGAPEAVGAIQTASPAGQPFGGLESAARAFAPLTAPVIAKPRPLDETHESVSQAGEPPAPGLAVAADNPDLDAASRLELVDYSLDRMETRQLATLADIGQTSARASARDAAIVAATGLDPAKLTAPAGAVGGPYIPLEVDAKAPVFDKIVAHVARNVALAEKLRALMPFMPLRKPLVGESSVTSPFGYRADPFLGRPALHPGLDLIQAYGAEIHCTGAGRVVRAGLMGGYGNMVEIDHGNGLATRYGHMSEVLVSEGQEVKAGAVVGRIGSTGRSTGPHLHYEVRIDGEPVDPERFLRAGAKLASAQ